MVPVVDCHEQIVCWHENPAGRSLDVALNSDLGTGNMIIGSFNPLHPTQTTTLSIDIRRIVKGKSVSIEQCDTRWCYNASASVVS